MDPLLLENLKEIKRDVKDLTVKVDKLHNWKATVVGGGLVILAIINIAFKLLEMAIVNK